MKLNNWRKILFCLFFIIFCLSCTKKTIKNESLKEGWVSVNRFVVRSIGYPKTSLDTKNTLIGDAYQAALNLANVKIENAFLKEVPKNIKSDYIRSIVEKYSKVVSYDYIDDRYIEMEVSVEYNDLFNILRNGDIEKLIE